MKSTFLALVSLILLTVGCSQFSATATSAPVPTSSIPPAWKAYRVGANRFTLAYPAEWKIYQEKPYAVWFEVKEGTLVTVGLLDFRFENSPRDSDRFLQALTSDYEQIANTRTGSWDDGVHHGIYAEFAGQDKVYRQWEYKILIGIPTRQATLLISWLHMLTKLEDDSVRDVLRQLTATIEIAPGE